MRHPRKKASIWIGTLITIGLTLTGCAWWGGGQASESREELAARIEPALLAVPGVTGGTLVVKSASLSHLYSCQLTSDAATPDELLIVLTDVVKTLAAEAENDAAGSQVMCSLTNGPDAVTTRDLGLSNPTSLRQIRDELG